MFILSIISRICPPIEVIFNKQLQKRIITYIYLASKWENFFNHHCLQTSYFIFNLIHRKIYFWCSNIWSFNLRNNELSLTFLKGKFLLWVILYFKWHWQSIAIVIEKLCTSLHLIVYFKWYWQLFLLYLSMVCW